jgi:NAD(P)H-hydrate epimerase
MLRILSADQIRAADAYTISHEPIASIDLMERAAQTFCRWFTRHFPASKNVYIFCGLGNNGGDGLAIARMLLQKNYCVTACIVRYGGKSSPDFDINYQRLSQTFPDSVHEVKSPADIPSIEKSAVIIDALFGSGLNKPLEGLAEEIVIWLNNQQATKVSVDIPSGLFADKRSEGTIFKADYTFSFELPRYSFLLPENYPYVGEFYFESIGLDKNFIAQQKTSNYYITTTAVAKILRPRKKFDHKGTYGHALIVGGSYGKIGAVYLAAKAALHSGCGLVTAFVPQCGYTILQAALPEAMLLTDKKEKYLTKIKTESRFSAAGIGPGIGTHPKTADALFEFLESINQPVVLDADALNILAGYPNQLHLIPKHSIITPHPKEFERLFGKTADHYQRHLLQSVKAVELNIYIVLKGAHTAIACPDGNTYFNSTGNPGMATAGSGDVLTGIITSFLAQGYNPFEAVILGVFLHGLAGDCVASKLSKPFIIATDIINGLSEAFLKIENCSHETS